MMCVAQRADANESVSPNSLSLVERIRPRPRNLYMHDRSLNCMDLQSEKSVPACSLQFNMRASFVWFSYHVHTQPISLPT